ncbi:hypothetical protein [Gracilibacillus sp. JCM 18860]|uniref:hypothetical protein n=1 Tax=Gracilibacillus sp. JCM 18860 TaxID=1306159 RepID=UPI0032612FDC
MAISSPSIKQLLLKMISGEITEANQVKDFLVHYFTREKRKRRGGPPRGMTSITTLY